jgi:hypothetical protein
MITFRRHSRNSPSAYNSDMLRYRRYLGVVRVDLVLHSRYPHLRRSYNHSIPLAINFFVKSCLHNSFGWHKAIRRLARSPVSFSSNSAAQLDRVRGPCWLRTRIREPHIDAHGTDDAHQCAHLGTVSPSMPSIAATCIIGVTRDYSGSSRLGEYWANTMLIF